MKHRDPRGSWATGWGRRVRRYPHGAWRGLAGVTPVRARSVRMRGWRVPRQFDHIRLSHVMTHRKYVAALPSVLYRAQNSTRSWQPVKQRSVEGSRLVLSPWHRASVRYPSRVRPRNRVFGLALRRTRTAPLPNGAWLHRPHRDQTHRVLPQWSKVRSTLGERIKRPNRAIAPVRRGADIGYHAEAFVSRMSGRGDRPHEIIASHRSSASGSGSAGAERGPRIRQGGDRPVPLADDASVVSQTEGPSLSGHDMMSWFGRVFGDEARRPPSGPTRHDSMLAPIYPGRKPSF